MALPHQAFTLAPGKNVSQTSMFPPGPPFDFFEDRHRLGLPKEHADLREILQRGGKHCFRCAEAIDLA